VSEDPKVRGWFEPEHLDVPPGAQFTVELVVRNEGDGDAFVFVPDRPKVAVLEDGEQEVSPGTQPDGGLVGERRLAAGETYRDEVPLSNLLTVREPGRYLVECTIRVDASDRSIGDGGGTEVGVDVASRIELNISPEEVQR
jgi:hypothetical protein